MLENKNFGCLSIKCMLFFFFFSNFVVFCGFIIFRAARLCVNDWTGEIRGNSMGANEELEEIDGSTRVYKLVLESTNRICLHK